VRLHFLLQLRMTDRTSESSPSGIYSEGLALLAEHQPARAAEAFSRAAALGHPAAHAAAAAIYFEGAVSGDGTVVDGDVIKAYDMCERSHLALRFSGC
jgi:TPR repeat protein